MATHDSLFRRTFADVGHAAEMFRVVLPARLVAAIDWTTLRALPTDLVDAELDEHRLDQPFAVRLRDHDAWLILIAEHKSVDDPGLTLQLLRYTFVVLECWRAEHPGELGLPPVIPVLFHHGDRPFRAPCSLFGHMDLGGLDEVRAADPALAEIIRCLAVSLAALPLDLGGKDEAWLRRSGLPPLVQLVCLVMRFVRFQNPEEGVATLDRWRDVLRAVHAAPGGQERFAGVESYLLQITDLTPEQLRGVVERAVGNGERVMGTAERLRKEGYARGVAEGIEQGKAEGIEQGKAEGIEQGKAEGIEQGKAEGIEQGRSQGRMLTLLRLIERRFGAPTEAALARVRSAADADLERWTDRVLDAQTIDDLLAG